MRNHVFQGYSLFILKSRSGVFNVPVGKEVMS